MTSTSELLWLSQQEQNINRCNQTRFAVERLRTGRSDFQGSIPGGEWKLFPSPRRPERLWGPASLLSSGYQELFL